MDRFVGVTVDSCATFCCTAASGWVDRFVAVTMMYVPVVCPPFRGLLCFFIFPFFSRYPGPALAQFSIPLMELLRGII